MTIVIAVLTMDTCCRNFRRINRRAFLHAGLLGTTGLSLVDLARLSSAAAVSKPPKSRANDRAVILLWMDGGPSHFETYDMKPEAPLEIRGEFKPARTAVPGIHICEHLPRQARLMDRFAIVRSLAHRENLHEGAIHWVHTGYGYPRAFDPIDQRHARNPAMGAVVAREVGPVHAGVPPYVKVLNDLGTYQHSYQGASYLGPVYEPILLGGPPAHRAFDEPAPLSPEHFRAPTLALADDTPYARLEDRRSLLDDIDSLRRRIESSHTLDRMDQFHRQALELLLSASVRDAFDISREDPRLRDRYGHHIWGQGALLARRLVEAGVRFVTVNLYGRSANPLVEYAWDTHKKCFPGLKDRLLPVFDQLLAALVEDLCQRGLYDRVLVVAVGEFGRTPRINKDAGRDHWASAMSALLGGAGIRTGHVVGSTDRHGSAPDNRPLQPGDLLATIYSVLGVDAHATVPDQFGRPMPILPEGAPIGELLA